MKGLKRTQKNKEPEKMPAGYETGPETDRMPQATGVPEVEPGSIIQEVPAGAETEGGRTAASAAELEERLLRLAAEYANYKRRTDKEKEDLGIFAKVLILRDILPVLEDFNRFFEHLQQAENDLEKGFVQGVEMIRNNLVKVLEKHGVEPIAATGVPVDYNLHEAVLTEPVSNMEEDQTVRQVFAVGYRVKDRDIVIRHAKVKVGLFSPE